MTTVIAVVALLMLAFAAGVAATVWTARRIPEVGDLCSPPSSPSALQDGPATRLSSCWREGCQDKGHDHTDRDEVWR